MPRNFDGCFLLFLVSSLALKSHGGSNSTVVESERRNKWVEGEAIVSNEIIRYQGFLGFGIWNGGILSTPNASQYRHWVRCSATHSGSYSITFLVGGDFNNADILQEMFTYKDILLFDVYESYGFPVALKVFGFFNAVLKFRPNSKFIIKSDHDVQVDSIQTIIEETRSLNVPVYYGKVWGGEGEWPRIKVIRDKNSKHYVSVNAFSFSHYPPFCSGWGYAVDVQTLQKIRNLSETSSYAANEDSWLGIFANQLGIRPIEGNISFKGNVVLSDNDYYPTMDFCPSIIRHVCGFALPKLQFVYCHNRTFITRETEGQNLRYSLSDDSNMIFRSNNNGGRAKPSYINKAPSVDTVQGNIRIRIIVMVSSKDPYNLYALLRSLKAANYGNNTNMCLDLLLQKNNKEVSIYEAQLAVAESFHWIHGKKRVLISDKMLKKNIAWMNAWIPESNDEYAIFLHDTGLKVSPDYYLWLVNALQQFQNSSYIYGATLNAKTSEIDKEFIHDTVIVTQLDNWAGFVLRADWWRKFSAWLPQSNSHGTLQSKRNSIYQDFMKFISTLPRLNDRLNLGCLAPSSPLLITGHSSEYQVQDQAKCFWPRGSRYGDFDKNCPYGPNSGKSVVDIHFIGANVFEDQLILYSSVARHLENEHTICIRAECNREEVSICDSNSKFMYASKSTFVSSIRIYSELSCTITTYVVHKSEKRLLLASSRVKLLTSSKISAPSIQQSSLPSVDIIIFTKDRPMELANQLASIERHVSGHSAIHVIFQASNECSKNGYKIVRRRHLAYNFVNQDFFGSATKNNFEKGTSDFMHAVMGILNSSAASHIIPIVSEAVFIRAVNVQQLAMQLMDFDPFSTVQLRLGTHLQGYTELERMYPERFIPKQHQGSISQNVLIYDALAGCQFICGENEKIIANHFWFISHFSGALYEKSNLFKMWKTLVFNHPGDLETQFYYLRHLFPRYHLMLKQAAIISLDIYSEVRPDHARKSPLKNRKDSNLECIKFLSNYSAAILIKHDGKLLPDTYNFFDL